MMDHPIADEPQSARGLIVALAHSYGLQLASADADPELSNQPIKPGTADARLATAKAWIQARRLRDELLDSDLFADPAWDMLLELYEKHYEGKPVTVTCACLAARVPSATAFRQLSRLRSKGLIDRNDDGSDRRRVHLALTQRALETMDAVMDATFAAERRLKMHDIGPS